MIIDAISDLHGQEPKMPEGDLLIVAGDCTLKNGISHWTRFFDWFYEQPHKHKILIGGNHDHLLALEKDSLKAKNAGFGGTWFHYLEDSGVEIEGIKFWGVPHTPWFRGVCPDFKKFMYDSQEKGERYFSMIPRGIDVLITHGPPYMVLDENKYGTNCGCPILYRYLAKLRPKLHIFGHIHEQGGKQIIFKQPGRDIICSNVSYLDENYNVRGGPTRFKLQDGRFSIVS